MIITKYNYTPISRQSVNGKRLYSTPTGDKVPSVTTILSATKPKKAREALNNWKKRVGEKQAQQITTEAANVGTCMHKKLEEYCLGTLQNPGSNLVQQQAHKMANEVITQGMQHVDEIWGVEVPLYFPGLYAGTTDCVGTWKGQPAILDFKQTNKPKKREWIDDYFLQLCAYGMAHNEVHDTNINQGVILMCSRNFEYQEFVIEGDEYKEYEKKWTDRVAEYYHIA